MKIKQLFIFLLSFITLSQSIAAQKNELDAGMYAHFNTTKGEVLISLFHKEMPANVANFVALAEGKMRGDLKSEYQKKAFYNGSVFSRALEGYMVSSHNKLVGVSNQSIGYDLPMEFNDSIASIPNILCVSSNSGLNDGSQLLFVFKQVPFFSQASVPIGVIVQGVDVAKSLQKGDELTEVNIIRVGKEAKRFKSTKVVKSELEKAALEEAAYKASELDRAIASLNILSESEDKVYGFFAKSKLEVIENGEVLPSGVRITKWKTTDGALPVKGQYIWVSYVGYLPDGNVFDSSYDTSKAARYTFGAGESIKAWDEVFKDMHVGEKATIIVPSSSAYGKEGAGQDIPPYTTIIFDVTLEKIEDAE